LQKLSKHQSLSQENRIKPNNFTPITSEMVKKKFLPVFDIIIF